MGKFDWDDTTPLVFESRVVEVEQSCGHVTAWDIDDRIDESEFRFVLETTPCQACVTKNEIDWSKTYGDSER